MCATGDQTQGLLVLGTCNSFEGIVVVRNTLHKQVPSWLIGIFYITHFATQISFIPLGGSPMSRHPTEQNLSNH